MTRTLAFIVPGKPVGKGRPRFVKASGRSYTPPATVAYEQAVAIAGRFARQDAKFTEPLSGPLVLWVTAVFPRPKRLMRKKDPAERMPHISSPDLDNIVKAIGDGLIKGGVIADDRLICSVHAIKLYTAKEHDEPHCHITIGEYPP